MDNPFLTVGYVGAEYFCDRVDETKKLIRLLTNGNNVALISPRRMGKTGLIRHCFAQKKISSQYNTFIIDIYATKNLADFVYEMGRQIVNDLKPRGRKAIERFVGIVKSLKSGITFDIQGMPSWNLQLGDIQMPQVTLDEVFHYIESSEKPCLIAIDEFQTITTYPEQNVEATLRTYVQRCSRAKFIFSGSQRSMMSELFASAARPFYQSVSIVNLGVIPEDKYKNFIETWFKRGERSISGECIRETYQKFDGVTWYIQKMMNSIYSLTSKGGAAGSRELETALSEIIDENADSYANLLYLISPSQKALLVAIGKEGKAVCVTGREFVKKYRLPSASSVQKAALALQEKQLITNEQGVFEIYDKFMALWLMRR